ncbi:hypothetical protein GCM10022388_05800 [Flavobacterium chungnamense]|uniref:Helicase HerA-like C-terminal domain-containing protein n=1 Tax=Flavobacterium chungnamense TaxID=706182 RepID=A0ABP7UIA3_9FLAO
MGRGKKMNNIGTLREVKKCIIFALNKKTILIFITMSKKDNFIQHINEGYTSKGESLILGAAILEGEPIGETQVKIPLKTLNRHGLIAGATGTGKTKTIQVLSEQLSSFGIPVLMMDIKGDFSGIAQPGEEKPFITERHAKINIP